MFDICAENIHYYDIASARTLENLTHYKALYLAVNLQFYSILIQ